MLTDAAGPLAEGLRLALAPAPLAAVGFGTLIGWVVGMWSGAGALAAIALLMPLLVQIDVLPALALVAGLYHGAQVGGAWGVVLTGAPGEPSALAASADALALARRGRARSALAVAIGSSFGAGLAALGLVVVAIPVALTLAFHFGPAEYVALSVLALAGAVAWSPGSTVKALAMALLGLLAGRWLAPGGDAALPALPGLAAEAPAAVAFVALVVGVFALSEVVAALAAPRRPPSAPQDADPATALAAPSPAAEAEAAGPAPSTGRTLRVALPAAVRGTLLGSVLGVLPGGGAVLAAFAARAVEQRIAGTAADAVPGDGALRGVAGPESASNAGAQSAFLPALALGLPPNAVMALVIGTLALHGVAAGPSLATGHPGLLWGLVASMAIGHGLLLLFGLALWLTLVVGPGRPAWPRRPAGPGPADGPLADAPASVTGGGGGGGGGGAGAPPRPTAPAWRACLAWRAWAAAAVWSAWIGLAVLGLGALGIGVGPAALAAALALAAVLAQRLGCPPAPLVLGVVLWPPLEGQLLRLLAQDGGPATALAGRPLALGLVTAAALWVAAVALSRWRRRRARLPRTGR